MTKHRAHRVHRAKTQISALSVSSVVNYPGLDSFNQRMGLPQSGHTFVQEALAQITWYHNITMPGRNRMTSPALVSSFARPGTELLQNMRFAI